MSVVLTAMLLLEHPEGSLGRLGIAGNKKSNQGVDQDCNPGHCINHLSIPPKGDSDRPSCRAASECLLHSPYMSEREEHVEGLPLTAIYINLEEHRVELESSHGTVASVSFPSVGTIYFNGGEPRPTDSVSGPEDGEKNRPIVLTGRLKNKPREGRADRSGNPTAYARFSAHVEGEEGPHDYIATFHRHTTQLALGLAANAQITVEGYPHASQSEKRLDSFSVINVLNWPGKPRPS